MTLALTFGFYGLLRKTAVLKALEGLSVEMTVLFWPAVVYLIYLERQQLSTFGHTGWMITLLLMATGIVTAIPLLLFAYGAQRINLSTLGILQYVAPTLQFLLGVLLYREDFAQARAIGFSIIWFALLIYSAEGLIWYRRRQPVSV